jgi:hypothetical protein
MAQHPNRNLDIYERYESAQAPKSDRLFTVLLLLCIGVAVGGGIYFRTVKVLPVDFNEQVRRISAQFIIKQKIKPAPVKKNVEEKAAVKAPIDLTPKPVLDQKQDDIQKPVEKPKVRRVYGLRRVYSRGIGAGGALSDAVVGKLGNTLNKDFDTLTATAADIKGEVVSVTTVTSMPKILKTVKPDYTAEMIQNKIEGSIRLKILVDIDGKVKKAEALNDLGYGSAGRAVQACYEMLFEPAMQGLAPVATIITISIKFVLLG